MSEKRKIQRFNLDEGRIWEAIEGLSPFKTTYTLEEVCEKLNEQQAIIEELKTHNLQHFLEWLVIKGYVTDEPLKDINNVIDCVDEFKECLTELDKFKEWLEVLEDE